MRRSWRRPEAYRRYLNWRRRVSARAKTCSNVSWSRLEAKPYENWMTCSWPQVRNVCASGVNARISAGYPVIVAENDSGLIGYASFGDFRAWPGYRFTVEHSVYARADHRGKGVGGALMRELIDRARAMGKHVMIGGVDADNTASLRFHERLGFEKVAHFKQVGFKFGRWLDLTFLQLTL